MFTQRLLDLNTPGLRYDSTRMRYWKKIHGVTKLLRQLRVHEFVKTNTKLAVNASSSAPAGMIVVAPMLYLMEKGISESYTSIANSSAVVHYRVRTADAGPALINEAMDEEDWEMVF